jgi:hypothetical protein
MSFKNFLNMAPEDDVIESSSLTKFRKLRLKDMNLLDMLVNKTVEIAIGTDMNGNALTKDIQVLDDEQMPLYLKLKAMASGTWKKYNLKELVKSMREIISNDGFKDEELLERGIVDDALAKDKTNYTARMRALAIKVKGMEKTNALQQINVYVEGGGKQLNKTIIESSGNDNYDLAIEDSEEGEE